LRARAHARGRDPHDLGHLAALDGGALSRLRPGPRARGHRARLQPDRGGGQPRDRAGHRVAAHPHRVRAHRQGRRRQPRDGRGPRRRPSPGVRPRVHARHRTRHAGGRAGHPGHRGHERDGDRADRGGVRGGGHRRPRQHAGGVRGRAGGRHPARPRDLRPSRDRDAADLPDRDRRAGAAAARAVRGGHRVRRALGPGLALLAILIVPLVAPPYQTLLMLPFMAYAVALLGLNLLFGYTGLLSFGHALFVGIGAYTGAFLTHRFGVRSLEIILVVAAVLGALVAAPVAALCVRYVKIYFG